MRPTTYMADENMPHENKNENFDIDDKQIFLRILEMKFKNINLRYKA